MPETPAAGSSDVERARLRAAGFSDDEIARILVARGPVLPAGTTAGVPQAPVSGAMSNFSAMWTHARNIIPSMAAQIVLVFDTSAAAAARVTALLSVIVKTAFVLIFAYAVSLEFSQLRSSVDQTQAQARLTKIQADAMGRPMNVVEPPWDLSSPATQEDIARLKRLNATNPLDGPCNPEVAPFVPGIAGHIDNPENRCVAPDYHFHTHYHHY